MIKGEDLKRLINFSDAIVAVAITQLVIPLTDLFQNFSGDNLLHVFTSIEFSAKFSSFLISFFVIYSVWETHRKLFSGINEINIAVAKYNRLWLLCTVLIPAATMVNIGYSNNLGIYIYGLILIINILLLQIIKKRVGQVSTTFEHTTLQILILCLILLTIFPNLGHGVYYLLIFDASINRLKKWMITKKKAS